MSKIILYISLVGTIISLSFFLEDSIVFAKETLSNTEHIQEIKKVDSCTVRCHVNYMAYENEFEVTQRAEVFRHKTHSFEQNLSCTFCHDNSEVNTEGHGKLTIKRENCLKCHHVELKESECKRCHHDIDENSMKYKEEKFIHGFTVESDVDCGLCHVKDSNASLKDEEINCVKCHHTTPGLDCAKCHEDDLDKYHDTVPEKVDRLSWSVSFRHSQHPENNLSCKDCHSINHENDVGMVEYNINCSKCHHVSDDGAECVECHKEPLAYLIGETGLKEIAPAPDIMSRAVKCNDCHKYNEESLEFKGVEEYCIECHNGDYGKLYNAWIKSIKDRLEEFNLRVQLLVGEDVRNIDVDPGRQEKAVGRVDMDTFLEKSGFAVGLVSRYGTHNFNLSRAILDSLEEELGRIKE